MKMNLRISKKIILLAMVVAGMAGMCACGSQEEEDGGNYVSIESDGTVKSGIKESFEESYYDAEELKESVLSLAADYNKTAGEGHISVEKVEVENDMAEVLMSYQEPEDYAAFNEAVLFAGSPVQAQDAGFDLNIVLSEVKNAQSTVGKADILAMEDATLIITDISEALRLGGKALYVSDNVTVSKNAKTVRLSEGTSGMAYIIFK